MLTEQQIRAFLTGPVKKSGIHLICTCPTCGKQLHAYFNLKTGLWDCKKCNCTGNLNSFLRGWGQLHLLEGNQVTYDQIKPLEVQTFVKESLDLTVADIHLPAGFTPLQYKTPTIYSKYLIERKYTPLTFQQYVPGYTDLISKYENYVIIPIYRDFSIKGFIARNILNDDRPRYQNRKGVKFARLLDGLDEVTSNTHTVILVEGHFDRVSVTTELNLDLTTEIKALSTFGKRLSDYQIELLRRTNVKDIYLFYDTRDAIQEIKTCGLRAAKYFNVKGCYTTTNRDPGAMTKLEILNTLQTAQNIRDFSISKVQIGKIK